MKKDLDKIYKESMRNNKQLYIKTEEEIKEYDKIAEELSTKSIENLNKYCSKINNKLKEYHSSHNISIDDPSPIRNIYDKCKRLYTHDVLEFLEYNNNKFNYMSSQFSEKISICDQKYSDINSIKDIQECYDKEGLKYFIRLEDFLDNANKIAMKKLEYLVEVDKGFGK